MKMLKTLIIFSALAASTPLQAQTSDDSLHVVDEIVITGSRLKIPTHNTAAKIPLPLRNTPLSVGIVDEALIETQDGTTLSDALANISGVGVHTNFGVHDLFYLRGFDSLANGLVLSDGAPEPEATFYQLYNVDRVEALKGPGAFLYGGNPLSGTINLVRKRAVTTSNFTRINSSVGRYATYRATLDAGRALPEKNLGLRFNALWQDAGGYRNDKGNAIIAINPTLEIGLGQRATLNLDFEYLTSEYRSDSGLPIIGETLPAVPRTRSYQSPFDLSEQTIYRFRADSEYRLNPTITLRDKLYYARLDWPSRGTLFSGAFPNAAGSLDLVRTLLDLDDRQTIVGNQIEALLSLDTGGFRHQLLLGFEFSSHTDDFTLDVAVLPTIDLFAPIETAAEPLFFLPDQATAGQTTALTQAPYLIDHITVGSRLGLFIGARFDRVDYQDALSSPRRDYKQFSPMLGAVFTPNDDLSLYANTGRAFAAPSARISGPRDAEESIQYEIGVKTLLLSGKLNAQIALFNLAKDNIAIPDDNGITQQIGDQCARGLELEVIARPTQDWYAQASYAYLNAELTRFSEFVLTPTSEGFVPRLFDRTGNRPAFAPEHLWTLWAARDLGAHFTLAGGGRYVGSQFVAEDNSYQVDGALTIDLGLTYRQGPGHLRINLKNILSSQYETRGFGASSVIPATPFTLKATVGYSL